MSDYDDMQEMVDAAFAEANESKRDELIKVIRERVARMRSEDRDSMLTSSLVVTTAGITEENPLKVTLNSEDARLMPALMHMRIMLNVGKRSRLLSVNQIQREAMFNIVFGHDSDEATHWTHVTQEWVTLKMLSLSVLYDLMASVIDGQDDHEVGLLLEAFHIVRHNLDTFKDKHPNIPMFDYDEEMKL